MSPGDPIDGEDEVVALAVTPRELERGSQRRVYVRSLKRCFACGGSWSACQVCRGEGRVPDEWLVDVEVPAGSKIGGVITASGQGEKGTRGGSDGDLIIVVVPRRTGQPVDGADYTEGLELDQERLREGGSEYFPLLGFGPCEDHHVPECNACSDQGWSLIDASRVITIPPNSQWGQWLRIPGEGMPGADGGQAGDLYVQLVPSGYDDEPLPDLGTIDTTLAEPALPYRTLLVENDGEQEEEVEVGEYFHATAAPEGSEAHFQTQTESRSQPDELPLGWAIRPGEDILRYVGTTAPGVTAQIASGAGEPAFGEEPAFGSDPVYRDDNDDDDTPFGTPPPGYAPASAPTKKPYTGPIPGLNVVFVLSVPAEHMKSGFTHNFQYGVMIRCEACGGEVGCDQCDESFQQEYRWDVDVPLGPFPEVWTVTTFPGGGFSGQRGGKDGTLIVVCMTRGKEFKLDPFIEAPTEDEPVVRFYTTKDDVTKL